MMFQISFYGQQWNTLADVTMSGSNIRKFRIINDSLYVGASVGMVNGSNTTGILIWEGTEWTTISPSIASVFDFSYYMAQLHIVGSFNDIDDLPYTIGIARWDGATWNSVGGGGGDIQDGPYQCEVFQDRLYVSHSFNDMGDLINIFGFAAWDGQEWIEPEALLGFDLGPQVLCLFQDKLIGGGDFAESSTGTVVYNIAMFDGEHWADMNGGVNGTVQALYPDEESGVLYVGGNCNLAQFGNVEIPNSIAMWNGTDWQSIGIYNEINYDIHAICKYHDQVYVGGYFQLNGNTEKLAYFDGVHWLPVPLAGTIGGQVNALMVYQDELYVGGTFDAIGGLEVPGIARYYLHPDSVQWGVEDTTDVVNRITPRNTFRIYPNPTHGKIVVEFDKAQDGEILVTDLNGKQLCSLAINGKSRIDVDISTYEVSGVFISWVQYGAIVITEKVILNQ
jgi:hypothetical protein